MEISEDLIRSNKEDRIFSANDRILFANDRELPANDRLLSIMIVYFQL